MKDRPRPTAKPREEKARRSANLYPDNQAESKTLKGIIDSLIEMRPNLAKDRTVIIDAGIATKENIEYLKENHFHYIVVNRGKGDFSASDATQMELIRQTEKYSIEVNRKQIEGGSLCAVPQHGSSGEG